MSEDAAPTTRAFALVTGTVGLLAVGILVMTVTPRRHESPIAISATTTPLSVVATLRPLGTVGSSDGIAALAGRGTTTDRAVDRSRQQPVLATPFGDDGLAFVTSASLNGLADAVRRGRLEVSLPSGRTAGAQIVQTGHAPLAIVSIGSVAGPALGIASRQPAPSEMVTVLASPPISVAFSDVGELDVREGTAVLDGDGLLIGICTHGGRQGRVALILISDLLVGATIGDR